ncbi:glycosyltransferase [Ectothiorhodospira marina]|uniref:Glycosyltransferase involved in cell wall bisynthesis n=1 Tax=Ectothiorhodospira marina TaxID=1396821 RepID=A0A1H7ICA0_9GAMM|nr:glycosyltransferase [Ectothiorhodospira marina]SEK60099.1 Glycosyltransferase involved in cell wall bisynthesis [Ectothiorhodospira marina]
MVLSHVYPNGAQPTFGVFVRERMRRVGETLPVVVVAPVPWTPGQSLLRRLRPGYRPSVPYKEIQEDLVVYHPHFLCIPGMFKALDGLFEALGSLRTLRQIQRDRGIGVIDSHFIYPDGVAAWLLGRGLGVPYTITLRGTINRIAKTRVRLWLSRRAMAGAAHIFTVSASLRDTAMALGESPERVTVMSNGINLDLFRPEPRAEARSRWGVPEDARVLVSVGSLNERKGHHRVIATMPHLAREYPNLYLLIAGGGGPDGNNEHALQEQVRELGLGDRVRLLGSVPADELRWVYSAGDVFVLATRFEGWANVFLEAQACGLPVVTTNVGGNAEVINHESLGSIVPFGDSAALSASLHKALARQWDKEPILTHAQEQVWEKKIPPLVAALQKILESSCSSSSAASHARGRSRSPR